MNKKIINPEHQSRFKHYLKWTGIITLIVLISIPFAYLMYRDSLDFIILPPNEKVERPKILALSRKVYTQQCRKAGHPDNICLKAEYKTNSDAYGYGDYMWGVKILTPATVYDAYIVADYKKGKAIILSYESRILTPDGQVTDYEIPVSQIYKDLEETE